jgi:hypothetical protein
MPWLRLSGDRDKRLTASDFVSPASVGVYGAAPFVATWVSNEIVDAGTMA